MAADISYLIYALYDPRTNEPRYVGMSRNVDARFRNHLSHSHGDIRKWIQSLKSIGLKPYVTVLEEVKGFYLASRAEREWIYKLNLLNPLLNWTDSFQFVHHRRKLIRGYSKRRKEVVIARNLRYAIKGVECGLQRKIDYVKVGRCYKWRDAC